MNTHQKLADILALVTYIKEHIDADTPAKEDSKLDEIGQATLKIAEMLEAVESQTGAKASEQFAEYKNSVSQLSENICKKLTTVKDGLDANTRLTKDLHAKIEEVYTDYTGILKQSTSKLELQRENYALEISRISKEMKSLCNMVEQLNDRTLTEDEIKELMKSLEKHLSEVIAQDKELTDAHEQNMQRLERTVQSIQDSYHNLNETLASVDGSFKTAVSRLDVLLMQASLLTEQKAKRRD